MAQRRVFLEGTQKLPVKHLGQEELGEGLPGGLVVKNTPADAGDIRDTGLIPGSGRSPEGGHGNPLQ